MRVFYCTFIISVALMVGGFFCPPIGIIDGSILSAVGELLMFAVLAQVPAMLDSVRKGRSIKVQKGDFGVEVGSGNNL